MNWFEEFFIKEAKYALDRHSGSGISGTEKTIILIDEDGNEAVAVLTDETVDLNATANDIRLGVTAATNTGVTPGEKEIPAYHTEQGGRVVKPGESLDILMYSDRCNYTKLLVIVCSYNTSHDDSVSAEMVVIDNKLYDSKSTTVLANVTVDADNQTIKLGMTNNTDTSLLIRYMTMKEEP